MSLYIARVLRSTAKPVWSGSTSGGPILRSCAHQLNKFGNKQYLREFSTRPTDGNLSIFRRLVTLFSDRTGWENFPKPKKDKDGKDTKDTDKNTGKKEEKDEDDPEEKPSPYRGLVPYLFIGGLVLASWYNSEHSPEITPQKFLTDYLAKGQVSKLIVADRSIVRVYAKNRPESEGPVCYFRIGSVEVFEDRMEEAQGQVYKDKSMYFPIAYEDKTNIVGEALRFLPTLLIAGISLAMLRSMGKGGAGGIFSVMKSKAKPFQKESSSITFADVAGQPEAKQEIQEFVDFLKNPAKYAELGAKIPKGAILVGPPGTGKTLLAKATAGEAGVPFFSCAGSDFIEMFVGVGPSRVRDLFQQARESAPSIIFIDEIDAIGRSRSKGGFSGGNDERENTLNALLVEMDGFDPSTNVVVMAGTNRADVLDSALMRPGRFDRQISIDNPDLKSRQEIFDVHLKPIVMNNESKPEIAKKLATLTPGFSGADIANVCNEAALIAAREDCSEVVLNHFEAAIDRVIGGLEKKNKVMSPNEKKTVAFHEAGHAIVSWFLEHTAPLLKVSIVPRGTAALGFAQYLPKDQYLMTKDQMEDTICMALGGRAAEQLCIGTISTGAHDDLQKVTRLAYSQVTLYGMNARVGLVSFRKEGGGFAQRPYSEETAEMMDEEVRHLVAQIFERTISILSEHLDQLKQVAALLLEKEVLRQEDLLKILGPRPYPIPAVPNKDAPEAHAPPPVEPLPNTVNSQKYDDDETRK